MVICTSWSEDKSLIRERRGNASCLNCSELRLLFHHPNLWQLLHIPLVCNCQRFGFVTSVPLKHWKGSLESGVCPVKRGELFHYPQTSLYLLCKNYNGVTIFKAYFSIHKKKTFIFNQMNDVSLLPRIPQCLLEFFSSLYLLPITLVLSCSGPFICTLEFFSCKFV